MAWTELMERAAARDQLIQTIPRLVATEAMAPTAQMAAMEDPAETRRQCKSRLRLELEAMLCFRSACQRLANANSIWWIRKEAR